MHPAVSARYREEWCDNEMDATLARGTLDGYRRDGTDLLQILSLAERSHLAALLKASNDVGSGPSSLRNGEEDVWNLTKWIGVSMK